MKWLPSLLLLPLLACGGLRVRADAPASGNVLALTERASTVAARRAHAADPLVVLVEDRGVRAIDPVTAQQRWSHALPVAGHPVASATTVYVPLHGHRLLAVDRHTGVVRWKVQMPGEALTGLAVSEPIVVASVVDHRHGRSRLAALSTHDGAVRWMRRSDKLFGAPAAVGRVVLAPLGDQVLALRLHAGTERARLDVPRRDEPARNGEPAYERVAVFGKSLVAGEGTRWVDLRGAIAGTIDEPQRVDDGYGSVFAEFDGLDPGHGDDERLRFFVEFDRTSAAPRSAVLLCRRAVLSVRLDPQGHATESRWAHLAEDDQEFVAMDVGEHRVTLVREDGRILQLSRASGREIDRIAGGEPTRGALILDADRPVRDGTDDRADKSETLRRLASIVLDEDPRLLPAQRLVADLLWRSEDPWVREAVVQIARAEVRTETGEAAEALRRHALDLVEGPWGRPNDDELFALHHDLAERPSFLDGRRPAAAMLARRAVRAGDASMLTDLVEHLLHPGTPATDLPELVGALAEMKQSEAVEGLATFVRRYHADAQVVFESAALQRAVDVLVTRCTPDEENAAFARVAWAALHEVANDPFTEPSLRAYVTTRLPAEPADEPLALSN
jgi:hypothetical protein